jgi:hypothetical protein
MNKTLNKTLVSAKSRTTLKNFCFPSTSQEIPQEMFFCPEESQFYSQCLERMVFNTCQDFTSVVEFGAGDGSPVISGLLKSRFNGLINGYELNQNACDVANIRIEGYSLGQQYVVHNSDFFNCSAADYLIANPPYIPAIDNDIYLPALHGGTEGADITKKLFSLGFPHAMLMISSYSDPVGTIECAIAQGYLVKDFLTSPMPFGYYSSEPKVKHRIAELQNHGKAFYSENIYILAGVLFEMREDLKADLSMELIKVMTAL